MIGEKDVNTQDRINNEDKKFVRKVVHSFRAVIDFYRMEHSEDLTTLFNDFGYLLISRLSCEPYFKLVTGICDDEDLNIEAFSKSSNSINLSSSEEISIYCIELERRFKELVKYNRSLRAFKDFELTVKKTSILRQLFIIINDLKDYLNDTLNLSALEDAVWQIHDSCTNNKTDGRYVLSRKIVEQLVLLLIGENESKQGVTKTILDPQYGSGEMLISASTYLDNVEPFGFESNYQYRISAQILSIFSSIRIQEVGENFLEDETGRKYDLILANPSFNNQTVDADYFKPALPSSLYNIRSRYNLYIIRILQALDIKGRAAVIVPDSFLFSSKRETVSVRKWLMEAYQIEAIISLPAKTFHPNTTVNSSVIMISSQLMTEAWTRGTEHVFFYQMGYEAEGESKNDEQEELMQIWNQRSYYFNDWKEKTVHSLENYNNVRTPERWEHPSFWFADIESVKQAGWNLLPDHYKPAERLEFEFDDPVQLLMELIESQKGLLKDMEDLYEEVNRL